MLSEIEQIIAVSFNAISDSQSVLIKILSNSKVLVAELEAERRAKIQDIKMRIANGHYNVSSSDIARSLVSKVNF